MLQVKMQLVQYQSERLIAWSNLNAQLGGGFKNAIEGFQTTLSFIKSIGDIFGYAFNV